MSAAPERPDLLRELRWIATQPDVQSIGIHTSSACGQGVIGVSPRALAAFLDWVDALEAQRDAAREALELYADRRSYRVHIDAQRPDGRIIIGSWALEDRGKTARDALARFGEDGYG